MSLSAASSPRRVLDSSPLDDPRLVNSVDHAQSFANQQTNFAVTIASSPSFDDGIIDEVNFNQILELDEEDDHEFSSTMAEQFCIQARETIEKMKDAYKVASEAKNREHLIPLSDLGHFLKGSSAAIGAKHVKELCERAQHYGHCRDEEVEEDLSLEEALKRFDPLLKDLDQEINKAESWLVGWYKNQQPSIVLNIDGALTD